ncbi:MAG: hypothetical protein JO006_01730 [Paucibacter sp.]|nr:hypothetical protein [Roseateles sp.]
MWQAVANWSATGTRLRLSELSRIIHGKANKANKANNTNATEHGASA